MYAVFETGGKQYRAKKGDVIRVEKLVADEGATVDIDKVLMVSDGKQIHIGEPYIKGGKVTATVNTQGRGEKIKIVKFRRRKNSATQTGHRQAYTELKITAVSAG